MDVTTLIVRILAASLQDDEKKVNDYFEELRYNHKAARTELSRIIANKRKPICLSTLPKTPFLVWDSKGQVGIGRFEGRHLYFNGKREDLFNNILVYWYPIY